MVISKGLLKNVDFLRERMDKIRHKYKVAFRVGFWVPLFIFAFEIFYYSCLLIAQGIASVHEFAGYIEVRDDKMTFTTDMIIFVMPLVYIVFSFISFALKNKVTKYFLAAIDFAFFVVCIYVVVNGYHFWYLYAAGLLYSVAMFIACVDCIRADFDDIYLSKIEGYPHFNPILINEEIPMMSKIRFPDKKSYEQLYDERLEEFAKENPESQMAQLYMKEKEEKMDLSIGDWLDDMFTKNGKK